MRTILIIIGLLALLLLGMFLPFMPGEYDASAITISSVIQMLSISIILVPVGLAWWIFDRRGSARLSYRFALAMWGLSIPVLLIGLLGMLINQNSALFFFLCLLGVLGYYELFRRIRWMRNIPKTKSSHAPIYFVVIPIVLSVVRMNCIDVAVDYSRTRVIRQSQVLIQHIEKYRQSNGKYPVSLLSIWEDYKPGIRGVKRYYYELNGDAYNLYFEQYASEFSTKEVVMYNKLDEHTMTSHNEDLLLLSPQELERQRGYFKSERLKEEHWKYFWFD